MKNKLLVALALTLASTTAAWSQSPEPAKAKGEDKIARGLLMKHGEKLIFAPCRDRSYANVDDQSPQAALTKALTDFGLAPEKPLYVEFYGQLDGGSLQVSALNLASPQARCQSYGGPDESWRAVGHQPEWSLVVGEGHLRLQRKGKPDWLKPHGEISSADNLTKISTPDAPQAEWQFRKQLCHDRSESLLLGWQAAVKVDGETLQGCAWQR